MKNLLILLTVLASASVANAALFISVNGAVLGQPAPWEPPSEVRVIGVMGDGQTAAPLAAWLIVEGTGTVAGGDMLYPGTQSSIYSYVPGTGDGFENLVLWLESEGYRDVLGISHLEFAHGGDVQPPLEGLLVDGILLHYESLGDGMITLVNADLTEVYYTQEVFGVPEPITFVLLGLGGLFLRRRG